MTRTVGPQETFHHREGTERCSCPIHRARDREPFTAPLGLPFADHVDTVPISRKRAADIYAAHHGYMDDVPSVNLAHHGLRYQRNLLGAITYRYPLLRHKRLYLDADGRPLPEPMSADAIKRQLPERLHRTALESLSLARSTEATVVEQPVVDGDRFIEAARICLGVRMANFASAALARSQERFVSGPNCEGVDYLLTFVRADFDGAMIRALRDKGWSCVGWTRPSQASNREDRPIRERYKWVFVCPVAALTCEQAALGRWRDG